MTGDRRGESRWLSTKGRQKEHSPMLQKLRLSPPRLKSKIGDKDRLISRWAGNADEGGEYESIIGIFSSDSSVNSTEIKDWAIGGSKKNMGEPDAVRFITGRRIDTVSPSLYTRNDFSSLFCECCKGQNFRRREREREKHAQWHALWNDPAGSLLGDSACMMKWLV